MSGTGFPPVDPPEPIPDKPRSSKWVRITLFVSLAANLLVVGLVVGAIGLRGGPDRDGNPRLRDAGLGPLNAILSSEQRTALRGELRRHEGDLRHNREQMRNDLRAVLTALRSDPFDPTAFAALLSEQRSTIILRQEIGHQALIDTVSAASPSERAQMADKLERALSRGGPAKPKQN